MKRKLEDLYFGVVAPGIGGSGRIDELNLRPFNLFQSTRVRRAVARWVVETNKDSKFAKEHDFLFWCFGDTRARCEWEWLIAPWGGARGDEKLEDVCEKVDVYTMYVEPNAKYLRELVDSVSVSSAKKFLAEERRRYRNITKEANETKRKSD